MVRTAPFPPAPSTSTPVRMRTLPPAVRSASSEASTAFGSTTAVMRDQRARPTVRAEGSTPASPFSSSISTRAPFAVALRKSSSSTGSSDSSRATTTFPHSSRGSPFSLQ